MLKSITLENYKSFGKRQTVPFEAITVVVGPNNSGKSNLLRLPIFLRDVMTSNGLSVIEKHGGVRSLFHRPDVASGDLKIDLVLSGGSYESVTRRASGLPSRNVSERFLDADGSLLREAVATDDSQEFSPFGLLSLSGSGILDASLVRAGLATLRSASFVKLDLDALRLDSPVVPQPTLGEDGSGLAAVLGLWRGADPDRGAALDAFLSSCIPEIKSVLVRPSPDHGKQRLRVKQVDGEEFEPSELSDGVLVFIALAMHVIAAGDDALVLIEEPEHGIHPRRLGQLVDLLRRAHHERGCQFVIATHSPALLDHFRDEPEAIVMLRRGENGTEVRQFSEVPTLVEALRQHDAGPGEMLVNGFFNEPY